MSQSLATLARWIPRPRGGVGALVSLLVAITSLWLLGRLLWSAFQLVWILALVVATYFLLRPELATVFGASDDRRPWLVRFREHRWRSIGWGDAAIPRGVAYLLLAVAWYFTC